MVSLSKMNWLRLKYCLIFLPPLAFSVFVAVHVHFQTLEQKHISTKIVVLQAPLLAVMILTWIVVVKVGLMYIGILAGAPALTLGIAFSLIFTSIASIFIGSDFLSTTYRYEERMTRFSIVTKYQRMVTQHQLAHLYEDNRFAPSRTALANVYQYKQKCCGLKSFMDYNRGSGKYDAINADNDKADQKHAACKVNITWNAYLRRKTLPPSIALLSEKLVLKLDEDVPISCCKEEYLAAGTDCNKNIFTGDGTKLDQIYTEGCARKIMGANFHKSHGLDILILIFSVAWFAMLWTYIAGWSFLREYQGLRFFQCGHVTVSRGGEGGDEEKENQDAADGLERRKSSLSLSNNKVAPAPLNPVPK